MVYHKKILTHFLAFLLCSACFYMSQSVLSYAGDPAGYENTPVHMREHPDFQPQEQRVGSFIMRPVLETYTTVDTNVFLDKRDEVSDIAVEFLPALSLRSDFSRHALNIDVDGQATRYLEEENQNTIDAKIQVQGVLDLQQDMQLSATARIAKDHEDRNDSTIPSSPLEPTQTNTQSFELAFDYKPENFNLSLIGSYSINAYENGVTRDTRTRIVEEARDKDVFSFAARAGYDIHPNYTPFITASYSQERYDNREFQAITGGFTGRNQDKELISITPGLAFNQDDIIQGYLQVGLGYENTEDANTDDKMTYVLDGEIIWNPTKLTTLVGRANRSFDTDSTTNFGTVQTTAKVELHHELKRNFIIGTGLETKWRDFDNSARLDRTLSASLFGEYALNRNVSLAAEYAFNRRLSEATEFDYTQNIFMIGLKSKF